jgi:vacuolar-type H+-ATPase subunit E/Vma4
MEYSFENQDRQCRLRNISRLIGEVFVEVYDQLTAPPRGKKILLINEQLKKCVKHLSTTHLDGLFQDGIEKHIYYICGFLCRKQ